MTPIRALLVTLALASNARADTMDEWLGNLGLELRAFAGGSPTLGSHLLYGVDAKGVWQNDRVGVLVGGRALAAGLSNYQGAVGTKPTSEQLAQVEVGARLFLFPDRLLGLYVGAGLAAGSMYVDVFGFRHADAYGGYLELGLEWPRNDTVRLESALRVSGGAAPLVAFSRIPADGWYLAVTLEVGVLFGGSRTGNTSASIDVNLGGSQLPP